MKARMAGQLMKYLGGNFAKAYPKATRGKEILGSVIPDVVFGGMSAMMTPGDLSDKVIAGVTDAAIGAGMTGGLRGALGKAPGSLVGTAIEYGGGMASGMVSMPATDALLRLKGGGESPYDKLQQEQYADIRRQVEQDLYNQMTAGVRAPVMSDPFGNEGVY